MAKPLRIKLTIPEPCSENWDKMTVSERGRFCSRCSNIITDFSTFTDKELVEYISKANAKICGRFENTQLDRVIAIYEPANTPVFKRLLYGTALAAGVAGSLQSQVRSTTPSEIKATRSGSNIDLISPAYKPTDDSTFKITGYIIDSVTKQPLPFANVILEQGDKMITGITADDYGKFEIFASKDFSNKKLTIRSAYYGFHDWSKIFTLTKLASNFSIEMKQDSSVDSVKVVKVTMGYVSPIIIKSINTDTIIKKVKK